MCFVIYLSFDIAKFTFLFCIKSTLCVALSRSAPIFELEHPNEFSRRFLFILQRYNTYRFRLFKYDGEYVHYQIELKVPSHISLSSDLYVVCLHIFYINLRFVNKNLHIAMLEP